MSTTLISLDPNLEPKDGKDADRFHGWKVLGQTTIKDADVRKKVLDAVLKGIQENKGEAANCFQPRHGLHATHEGKTVDLVICFECLQIRAYGDGDNKMKGAWLFRF